MAAWLSAILLSACGGSDSDSDAGAVLDPKTGEHVVVEGELVRQPPEWPGDDLMLHSDRLRSDVFPVGDLKGFEAGDSVRVEGTFYEVSTRMRSVIRVSRIEDR